MLQKLGEMIGDCLLRAADARRQADEASDPRTKADWLRQEDTWSALARSYAFSESLDRFLRGNRDFRARWQTASTAPFHRDVELAVIDRGRTNAFVSPCRRTARGWVDANSGRALDLAPSHWREWRKPPGHDAASRAAPGASAANERGSSRSAVVIFDDERVALRIARGAGRTFALALRVDGEELVADDLDAAAVATIARRLLGAATSG